MKLLLLRILDLVGIFEPVHVKRRAVMDRTWQFAAALQHIVSVQVSWSGASPLLDHKYCSFSGLLSRVRRVYSSCYR